MRTISDHILDIVQNSIRANATLIEIVIDENKKSDIFSLEIRDNGCGMDKETLEEATNPFFTSRETRKVGLGLSLLKQNAERANGIFNINSEVGKGTEVEVVFQLSNFDKPPFGDIWDTYYYTFLSHDELDLRYHHKTEKGEFKIQSLEIKSLLGNVPIKQREVREAIIELIKNNLTDIEIVN
jgi:hypothetical protein